MNRSQAGNLTNNYSSFPIEGRAEERVLNKGLNFCPAPEKVNKTDVEAGFQAMRRSVLWANYFAQKSDENEGFTTSRDIIKVKKNNFPKGNPSRGVKNFLSSTHDAMMSAPLGPLKQLCLQMRKKLFKI